MVGELAAIRIGTRMSASAGTRTTCIRRSRSGPQGGMASAIPAVVRRAGKLLGSREQEIGNAQACNEGLEEEVTLQATCYAR